MKIKKLSLKNIGVFKNLEVNFKNDGNNIHIFVGENGSGKSTLLYCIGAFFCSKEYKTKLTPNQNKDFSIKLETDLNNFEFDKEHFSEKKEACFQNSEYHKKKNNLENEKFEYAVFSYSGMTVFNDISEKADLNNNLESPFENAISFSSKNSEKIINWFAKTDYQIEKAKKHKDREFANKKKKTIDKINKEISNILNAKFEFHYDYEKDEHVFKMDEKKFYYENFSEGEKSIISFISDLIIRLDQIRWNDNSKNILEQNFILLLDEIGLHLHPRLQKKILPAIKNIFPNAQIFTTTHSPFVVSSLSDYYIYELENGKIKDIRKSNDAESYVTILLGDFGIEDRFGENTEKLLDDFRKKIIKIRKNEISTENEKYKNILKKLKSKNSLEVNSIISFEKSKLKKH